jgi:DNA invertase Pin-like site-specific DNA recombinase
MAGLLAVFAAFEREVLQERTKAGLAHARENGKRLGRPATAAVHAAEIRKLHRAGISKSEIARRVQVGRTSVRRELTERERDLILKHTFAGSDLTDRLRILPSPGRIADILESYTDEPDESAP